MRASVVNSERNQLSLEKQKCFQYIREKRNVVLGMFKDFKVEESSVG